MSQAKVEEVKRTIEDLARRFQEQPDIEKLEKELVDASKQAALLELRRQVLEDEMRDVSTDLQNWKQAVTEVMRKIAVAKRNQRREQQKSST